MPVCDSDRVSLGEAPKQLDLLDPVTRFCDESLPANSIYGFLARERDRLFPDDLFRHFHMYAIEHAPDMFVRERVSLFELSPDVLARNNDKGWNRVLQKTVFERNQETLFPIEQEPYSPEYLE